MDWGAQGCLGGLNNSIPQISCVLVLFHDIIWAALMLGGTIALIFIIFAGIKLLTSGGDAKKVGAARQTLTFAIIGLLLIFFSFGIVFFLGTITGVSCIKTFGFTNCDKDLLLNNPYTPPKP